MSCFGKTNTMPTFALQNVRRNDRDVKGEIVFHLGRGLLGVDVEDIPVHLIELYSSKQPIERDAAHDERHAGGDCLILYGRYLHLSFARPPCGGRVGCGNLVWPERYKVASLIGISSNLRAVLTAHVTFQFMDGGRFRPTDDIQRHGLVSVTAQATDLKVEIPGVQRVTERR
jgi:hypothetical protein